MAKRLKTFGKIGLFFLLPLLVFTWTSIPGPAQFTLHLALVVLLVSVGLAFIKKASLQLPKTTVFSLLVLFLVGGTGWFLSPFFFLLYLLPIYLGFLYAPAVAFGFLAGLMIIFAFSVGEVDIAFDIMTLLSLLLVIPLIIYLRRQFLVIRQSNKEILILEEEGSGIQDLDTISRLLSNRITKLGVALRDPLTFIKQASSSLLDSGVPVSQMNNVLERIRSASTESLEFIRDFESDTSTNKVLTNQRSIIAPLKSKTVKEP